MVVWAEVKSIGAMPYREPSKKNEALAQWIEQGFVSIEAEVGTRGEEGADLYYCSIHPLDNTKKVGVGDARGVYFVEEITFESIDATLAEIEQNINKIWGRDWVDVSSRVSWYLIGEYEFMYEKDEPVLNPDGTINYNPEAYMESISIEEFFRRFGDEDALTPEFLEFLRKAGISEDTEKPLN